MFSAELTYIIEAAYQEAVTRRHAYFRLEHVLFALLFDTEIQEIIDACGGDVNRLKQEVTAFLNGEHEQYEPESGRPEQTPAVERLLQRAVMQVRSSGRREATGTDVLVALFGEEDSYALHFLEKEGISRLDVINFIAHGVRKREPHLFAERDDDSTTYHDDSHGDSHQEDGALDDSQQGERRAKRGALARFTEDLTALAIQGKLDPVIGRDREIERAIKILCRRTKNNPLLLGEPGVGKTAIAHAIAQRIATGDVPEDLRGATLFSLDMGTVVAGTRYRGDFEERLRSIIKEVGDVDKGILFIDEIHTMVGAGATGSASLDAANLLKPALASGKIRCLGSTTHEDYKKSFEKDRALVRRFSTIDVSEPTTEEAEKILEGLKSGFEKHHGVPFSPAALKAAVTLSTKYLKERFLPDKAIDVIDEAGASNKILPEASRVAIIGEAEIERVVSLMAKVPVESLSRSDSERLMNLESRMRSRLFGQDAAVEAMVRAIKRSRANLRGKTQPIGNFLFAGPTGVGKTELAKVLADELGIAFHRFDMSEFMEKHAVSRLVGAPPGYVGYEEGGLLVDAIRREPHAVLLLDEIEKAHSDIFSILLQIMDDAVLTDTHGRKADFRHVILIMTTNAGSDRSLGLGFGEGAKLGSRDTAIKQLFRPEFRNRLDEVIHFEPLGDVIVRQIVDKFIHELEGQLSDRRVNFELSDSAKAWLAAEGMDPLLGARPMRRVIDRAIKDPIADEILFGKLVHGGTVYIDTKQIEASTTSDGEEELTFVIKESLPLNQ